MFDQALIIPQLKRSLPLLLRHRPRASILLSEWISLEFMPIEDIDAAVSAARQAFKKTWGKNVTGFERSRLINKLADLIERDSQELAELEALNNGKPVRYAR